MLRSAWFIARHDTRHMLREKETLAWIFIMPIVFMHFIGNATTGFGRSSSDLDSLALVVPADAGILVERVEHHLKKNRYAVERFASHDAASESARILELPAAFTEMVLAGKQATAVLTREEGGVGSDYDQVRVSRALYTTLAEVIAAVSSGTEVSAENLVAMDTLPRALQIESRPAGKRKIIPSGFEQAVPGILIMFTLIALLTSGAVLMVIERQAGLLRRLSTSPLPREGIVLGKWLGKWIMGLMQCGFAMAAGSILFDMKWGAALPMVIVVLLCWSIFCASAGLLLGNLAQTEGQAVGFGVLSTNVLAALGGCWWPVEVTPDWMQALAKFLPTGWAMDAMHKLISFQAGGWSAVPHCVGLLSSAVVLGLIARRRFRFS